LGGKLGNTVQKEAKSPGRGLHQSLEDKTHWPTKWKTEESKLRHSKRGQRRGGRRRRVKKAKEGIQMKGVQQKNKIVFKVEGEGKQTRRVKGRRL
jgi:hypothetical protein